MFFRDAESNLYLIVREVDLHGKTPGKHMAAKRHEPFGANCRGESTGDGGLDMAGHISDDDLERFTLGTITDEAELAPLEEHLLVCGECIRRAEENEGFAEAVRAALKLTTGAGRRGKSKLGVRLRNRLALCHHSKTP